MSWTEVEGNVNATLTGNKVQRVDLIKDAEIRSTNFLASSVANTSNYSSVTCILEHNMRKPVKVTFYTPTDDGLLHSFDGQDWISNEVILPELSGNRKFDLNSYFDFLNNRRYTGIRFRVQATEAPTEGKLSLYMIGGA